MNRREVVKLFGLAGVSLVAPLGGIASSSAKEEKYQGPYWIMLDAGGGWDPTVFCDPKGGTPKDPAAYATDPTKYNAGWTDDSCNHFLKSEIVNVGPFSAAPVSYSAGGVELYTPARFFQDNGARVRVFNGVDTETNNHDVGTRTTWSGRAIEGQPALAALIAAYFSQDKDLPLAYISAGGYDATGGTVPIARSSTNFGVIKRVAYPNVVDVDQIGNGNPPQTYFSDKTASRIAATEIDRLNALQAKSTLPGEQKGQSALLLARQSMGGLVALANEIAKVDPVTPSKAFPDEIAADQDNAFGGDFNDLLTQAQLALHAFHAGVGVAANLAIGGFDTHSNHDQDQIPQMMKVLKAVTYVFRLAKQLGLDNNLYVVIGSDFGRTPYYNMGRGKDHWNVTSMVVAGPHIKGNAVIGASDAGFKPMNVMPDDATKMVADGDGVRIKPIDVNRALRQVAGMAGAALDQQFPLPGDPIARLLDG